MRILKHWYSVRLSGIAAQHADRGYSKAKRGNFGGSLVHNMYFIYSPDGTNVYSSRTTELQGSGSV